MGARLYLGNDCVHDHVPVQCRSPELGQGSLVALPEVVEIIDVLNQPDLGKCTVRELLWCLEGQLATYLPGEDEVTLRRFLRSRRLWWASDARLVLVVKSQSERVAEGRKGPLSPVGLRCLQCDFVCDFG